MRALSQLAACLLVCIPTLSSQAKNPKYVVPSPPQETKQFDFLVGTWDLDVSPNLPQAPQKMRGRWTARKAADGYMILDEYRAFDSEGNTIYLGETYRIYNAREKHWDFRYVEPFHATWYKGTGEKVGSEMHLTQKSAENSGPLLKIRIYDIAVDHFSWSSERSTDGGKTWSAGAMIKARRVK